MNRQRTTTARGRTAARAAAAVLAAAVAVGTTAGTASAQGIAPNPDPPPAPGVASADVGDGFTGKLATRLSEASGPVAVFVELTDTPAIDAFTAATSRGQAPPAAAAAANEATDAAEQTATEVVDELASTGADPEEIFRTSNAVSGVAVTADAERVRELVARPDVRAVYPLTPKTVTNGSADVLTQTLQTWQDTGLFGDDMRVGIVDTGIDHTHADFGGPGTVESFEAESLLAEDQTLTGDAFPTAKVVGGFDFVGDSYDASSTVAAAQQPVPDPNPLDCQGHGSHVAGTAGGFGVDADGNTFTGDYLALTEGQVQEMRIGPGTAPKAQLYALRVFGCTGSTNVTALALDYALDPDGDGDFSDRLDVINLSLGSDYGAPDDPENVFVQKLSDNGVLSVFAQGNGGDLYDVGGTPGNSPSALTVASSRDAAVLRDGAEVTAPADVAGIKGGQYSIAYDFDASGDRAGPVVPLTQAGNLDGCAPFSAEDAARVAGKIAWLEWDDSDATRECGSAARADTAANAGAVGAIFTSGLQQFAAGLSGNTRIPVFQFTGTDTAALRPALGAGTLAVSLRGELRLSITERFPAIEDTLSDFSSRGVRAPAVKPEVSAPGDTIVSAEVGSGNGRSLKSGTSMAAPHTAGIATLVREAHPDWSVEEVKAAVVNTTGPNVSSTENGEGPFYGPQRAGTGRVDALAATATEVLATVTDDPGYVSASFGVVEAGAPVELTKTVKLTNKSTRTITFDTSYDPATAQPGVAYSFSDDTVTVGPRGIATVVLTMSIEDPTALRKTLDPTMEATQLGLARQFVSDASGSVVLTPTSGSQGALQVPVYTAAKPTADITGPESVSIGAGQPQGVLNLSGRGLDQGTGSEAYTSLVTALQLTGTSDELPPCDVTAQVTASCVLNGTAAGADLRNVGVASTAPLAVEQGEPGEALLGFGINTWGSIYNLGSTNIPFVDIDTDGNGAFDFQTFLFKPPGTDLLLAATVDYDTGAQVDLQAVNGQLGNVDTNLFDTTVLVLPVRLSALGLDPAADSAPITFSVGVSGAYPAPGATTSTIDSIADMTFDAAAPALSVRGGGDAALGYQSSPGTSLVVNRDAGAAASDGSDSLLLIHHHNAVGDQAQIVPVEVEEEVPAPAPGPAVDERVWLLRDDLAPGRQKYTVFYGRPSDDTLACDVNGDGVDDLVSHNGGNWAVRTSAGPGAVSSGPARFFQYGGPGWVSVCGDWDGDGSDGIGVYDPANATWYLNNEAGPGVADSIFSYGFAGVVPVVGDWDGDGDDTVGVFERTRSNWWIRNGSGGGSASAILQYGFTGVLPAAGDFDGNGRTDLAVYDGGRWYIRTAPGAGTATTIVDYGDRGYTPVRGDWDGDGDDGIGVSTVGRR